MAAAASEPSWHEHTASSSHTTITDRQRSSGKGIHQPLLPPLGRSVAALSATSSRTPPTGAELTLLTPTRVQPPPPSTPDAGAHAMSQQSTPTTTTSGRLPKSDADLAHSSAAQEKQPTAPSPPLTHTGVAVTGPPSRVPPLTLLNQQHEHPSPPDTRPVAQLPVIIQAGADHPREPPASSTGHGAACTTPSTPSPSGSKLWLQFAASTLAGRTSARAHKINQDRFLVQTRIAGLNHVHLFGVCDGHGPNGHLAAQFVTDALAPALAEQLTKTEAPPFLRACTVTGNRTPTSGKQDSAKPLTHTEFAYVAYALRHAISSVEEAMFAHADTFDTSGTTLVCALLMGQHLVVANVGDSRALLIQGAEESGAASHATTDKRDRSRNPASHSGPHTVLSSASELAELTGTRGLCTSASTDANSCSGRSVSDPPLLTSVTMSRDHKPGDEVERERIERSGGLVAPSPVPRAGRLRSVRSGGGVLRVWNHPSPATGNRPTYGLAMSRSVGDRALTGVGVVSRPTVSYRQLHPGRDRALVLASDGVWDVLSENEVVRTAGSISATTMATARLCEAAAHAWDGDGMESRGVRDDISVLLVHFWMHLWGGTS